MTARRSRLARAAALLVLAGASHGSADSAEELVLEIPEKAIQTLLERASPLRGRTPEGIEYSIANPSVRIREGRILTSMDIDLYGGLSFLGAEVGLRLDGSLEGEIVARIDPASRTVEGGLEIRKLAITDLEELSDAEELKTFLNQNVTRFSYPVDIPMSEVPELSILLGGTITAIEVDGSRVILRARIKGAHAE